MKKIEREERRAFIKALVKEGYPIASITRRYNARFRTHYEEMRP